jgi:hypothetical protein
MATTHYAVAWLLPLRRGGATWTSPRAPGMTASSDSHRDSLIQRAAESLRGSQRADLLGTALAGMARDLADARRQIVRLRRENATLRAQLGAWPKISDGTDRNRGQPSTASSRK